SRLTCYTSHVQACTAYPCLAFRLPSFTTLFPYTTLFRSVDGHGGRHVLAPQQLVEAQPQHGPVHRGHPGERPPLGVLGQQLVDADRKSTRLNSSHVKISYAVFCLKKKKIRTQLELHDMLL